ncbi:MAG: hypothetical protein WD874_01270 [Parcubacteria group bacterium]
MKFWVFILTLILLPVFSIQGQTYTGVTPDDIIQGNIFLRVLPDVPEPNQQVTAILESSSLDLDSSVIIWTLNQAELRRGRGVKTVDFNTGRVGSRFTITATIDSPEGEYTKSLTLEIGSVDILWQGEGYVHPFYKGRTLWGRQTAVTLMAIPNIPGTRIENLIFRWSQNGSVIGSASGAGRNSLSVVDSILNLEKKITVEVFKGGAIPIAKASINIATADPVALVYENSPLLGIIFERSMEGLTLLKDKEITFSAFPFFFSGSARNADFFSYEWATNSRSVQKTASVTYRAPEGEGQSYVNLVIRNINKDLQEGTKDFLLKYNNEANF